MDTAIIAAMVTAAGGAIVAAVAFMLNARQNRKERLQERKIERYSELLTAVSDLAVKGLNPETNSRYDTALNTIGLTAPQYVIDALRRFHEEIRVSNPSRTQARHDALLKGLLLQMRRSLELPFPDDPDTFQFHLVGGFPSTPASTAGPVQATEGSPSAG